MLKTSKYDFSEEATFKAKLLARCKERYNKTLTQSEQLSDDDLELVTAAGASPEGRACTFQSLPCEKCAKYLPNSHFPNRCADGYKKQES